jgi:hypothetical protein
MKYDGVESWLETLTGDAKQQAEAVWNDHVAKFTVNMNYEPHSPAFVALWNSYVEQNVE